MHIEFIKNHGAYSPGDVAGFDPVVAEVLIKDKGVAVAKTWDDDPAPSVDAGGDSVQADPSVRGRRKK